VCFPQRNSSTLSERSVCVCGQEEDTANALWSIASHHTSSLSSWAISRSDLSIVCASAGIESVAVDRFWVEKIWAFMCTRNSKISSSSSFKVQFKI
jgi:hypothetical protein